jgi:hypothetical protein
MRLAKLEKRDSLQRDRLPSIIPPHVIDLARDELYRCVIA